MMLYVLFILIYDKFYTYFMEGVYDSLPNIQV